MSTGSYDIGVACLNGHEINGSGYRYSQFNAKFCKECGERATDRCAECGTQIRGSYHAEGIYGGGWKVPAHCHECGNPYPWTRRHSEALLDAIGELDDIPVEERDKLAKAVPDIISETPKSETAVLRLKKAAKKAGGVAGSVLLDVTKKVAAEGVKKMLGL